MGRTYKFWSRGRSVKIGILTSSEELVYGMRWLSLFKLAILFGSAAPSSVANGQIQKYFDTS
jgi:hypothetical protein